MLTDLVVNPEPKPCALIGHSAGKLTESSRLSSLSALPLWHGDCREPDEPVNFEVQPHMGERVVKDMKFALSRRLLARSGSTGRCASGHCHPLGRLLKVDGRTLSADSIPPRQL